MRPLCIFASPSVVDHSQIDLVVDKSAADATQRILTISAIPLPAPGNNNIHPFASNTTNNLAINGGSVTTRLTISNESILSTASATPPNTLTRLTWGFLPITAGDGIEVAPEQSSFNALGCQVGSSGTPGNFRYTWYLLNSATALPNFESWSEGTRPSPLAGPNTYPTLAYATLGNGSLDGKVLYCVIERNLANLCGVANSTTNAMYAFVKSATFDASGNGGGQSGTNQDGSRHSFRQITPFLAYPNPASDKITFKKNTSQNLRKSEGPQAIIIDTKGRKVFEIQSLNDNTQIMVKKLPQGLYRVVKKDSKQTLATFIKN